MHDLIIRGGTVADGSGQPTRTADVAVDGSVVTAVGRVDGPARRVIDADGLLVTPGWVDIHTHYDGQATWDPEVSPSGWHGVTTVVMGNCGVGFAPARESDRAWLIQLMEGVEDIPGTALAEGMNWNWETFGEYLDEVARTDRVLDVASLVPHGALRAYVLGEGRANDVADGDEIAEMAALVREAVQAGAIGASTTRTILHRAKDGELAAGTTAAAEELIAIGEALGQGGAPRLLGGQRHARPRPRVRLDVGDLRAGRHPGHLSGAAGRLRAGPVARVDRPRCRRQPARRLAGPAGGRQADLAHGGLPVGHPSLRPSPDLPGDRPAAAGRAGRPAAPARGARRHARPRSRGPAASCSCCAANLHKLFPLGDPPDYEPAPERSVTALAAAQGRTTDEVLYDLMLGRDGKELLYLPLLDYAACNLDAVREMLVHPATVLGLGDGGAHCGVLCDASLPTFMLAHWARDRSRGEQLPVETVVHLQTRRTAELYGFRDRGLLAPGYQADLNVIDHDALALEPPEMVYDLPASGKRLVQRARGYAATIKSGVVVREHDEATGERPGRLLRGPQPLPA